MIQQLNDINARDPEQLRSIYSFSTLISGLHKLDELVEMKEAKESIVLQLKWAIVSLIRKGRVSFDGEMLNAVISGPPGTGKTRLGSILAEIWQSLGILKRSVVSSKETTVDLFIRANEVCNRTSVKMINVSRRLTDLVQEIVDTGDVNRLFGELMEVKRDIVEVVRENIVEPSIEKAVLSDASFRVVGRSDLVAGYLGQTALKTKKLLEEMRGGVLFIDEAYTIMTSDKDSYGMEALTTLNQYMSEHPDEIIVIFGGYTDLMNETIFKHQPGLKRRCSWYFDVEGYSPEALAKIFSLQMKRIGWSIDEEIDTTAFFKKNLADFSNFGGDTEKFLFYCKLYQIDSDFERISTTSNKRRPTEVKQTITSETLEIALGKYRQNRVEKIGTTSSAPFGLYV